MYNGRQVIDPDSLVEMDSREIEVPYGGKDGAGQPVQKYRDVIKSVTAMTDRRMAYLVLAVEDQTKVNYAMPVRNMLYDAMQYAKQVEKAASSHRKSGDYKDADSEEFLSGFMRDDRLLPVATLVIYFGPGEWDGPMSIHEMFGELDEEMLSMVQDYRINVLAPAAIEDGDFGKFKTTLREVLEFIKYSRDADRLDELVENDEDFRQLGRDEVNLLKACVNVNLDVKEREEVLDVCKAWEDMQERAANKATNATYARTVRNLKETMNLSSEEAMDAIRVPEQQREEVRSLL